MGHDPRASSAAAPTKPGLSDAELRTRFTYHPPKADQPARYEQLRDAAHELARLIAHHSPSSREQSLALTHLEQAVMWANAAIARRE